MADKNNATCSICGKEYYMCLSCKDSINLSPWKVHTDTAECYKVFQVVRGYSTGVYTKDEARKKLKNINLLGLDEYRPHIKQIIKDILKESVVKTVTDENKIIEKTVVSRKKNHKVKNEVENMCE